jgi:hypothetical protein
MRVLEYHSSLQLELHAINLVRVPLSSGHDCSDTSCLNFSIFFTLGVA